MRLQRHLLTKLGNGKCLFPAKKPTPNTRPASSFKSRNGVTSEQGAAVFQPWHEGQEPQTKRNSCPAFIVRHAMGSLLKTSGLLMDEQFMVWGGTGQGVKPCITLGEP